MRERLCLGHGTIMNFTSFVHVPRWALSTDKAQSAPSLTPPNDIPAPFIDGVLTLSAVFSLAQTLI